MELAFPVSDGREWGNDEKGALDAYAMDLFQECDGLDGLSQAHLVGQDAVPSDRWKATRVRGGKVDTAGGRNKIKALIYQ